jgi:hypothetical protein
MVAHESKKHHYVPRFYLQHFCGADERVRFCFVKKYAPDYQDIQWASIKPDAVAYECNLNRDDTLGDPLLVEEHLSEIDSHSSHVISSVLQQRRLPADTASRNILIEYVAYQATRTPDAMKIAGVLDQWVDTGQLLPSPPYYRSGGALGVIERAKRIIPVAKELKWSLEETLPSNQFVTSSRPVGIYVRVPDVCGPASSGEPAGWPDAEFVTLPLAPTLALIGSRPKTGFRFPHSLRFRTALINGMTAYYAETIFAQNENTEYLSVDNKGPCKLAQFLTEADAESKRNLKPVPWQSDPHSMGILL